MARNAFTSLLGVELPIIQAPLAGVQGSALAIAVCQAGGLGSLPCAMLEPDAIRAELQAIVAATDKPWNVNFFCHQPPLPDAARDLGWREALRPYYDEFGLDTASFGGTSRNPYGPAVAAVLREFRPAVVSFHFGLPAAELLAEVKSWGAKVMGSATTVEEAVWLEAHGADIVIAQGAEAGGHRGMFLTDDITTQLGILALLPQVVDAVKLPVVAAGGIGDARTAAAAFALGAAAVQPGTAYLLCPESLTSAVHRAALQSDAARHTALTRLFTGRPARGIVNRVMRELGPMSPLAPEFPLATAGMNPLRKAAEALGSGDFSPLWSGQNAASARALPAAQVTRDILALWRG